jgi:UDP-galactopyranose mutase
MAKFDCLLVGAGLFNAVLAVKLKESGKRVLVVERRDYVGGNCHTYELSGITVHHHGAHIFHTSDWKAWDFANRFATFHPFVNSPVAMVKDGGWRAYNLPFNMNTFYRLWGYTTPEEAKARIDEETRPFIKETYRNLEEKALAMAGPTIYEKFIKGYTEKQWGADCRELSPHIITRIPLRFTYDNNYFDDTWQGIPVDGYTEWISAMLDGIPVELGVDYLANREKYDAMADKVFYSGRIDDYFGRSLGTLPYRSLEFQSHLFTTTGNFQGVAVTNWTGHEVSFTRRIEHRHFMSRRAQAARINSECTLVTTEYPAPMTEFSEAYYPVHTEESRKMYVDYLEMKPGKVEFTGRLGRFEYNDMDDTIIKALALAEKMR